MDRPNGITEMNLSNHPNHDAIAAITVAMARINPQSIEATKAQNYATYIYENLFVGKESQGTFYLTVAYLLGMVEDTLERKYGPKITKAVIPK